MFKPKERISESSPHAVVPVKRQPLFESQTIHQPVKEKEIDAPPLPRPPLPRPPRANARSPQDGGGSRQAGFSQPDTRVRQPSRARPASPPGRSPSGAIPRGEVAQADRFPLMGYVLLVAAVLIFSAAVLSWQYNRNKVTEIEPGPDGSIQGELSAYASAPLDRTVMGEDFPLQITDLFREDAYVVQKGDTVSGLASKYNVSMDAIIALNGISNARTLAVGKAIKIPNMDGIPYIVKAGDSYQGIAKAFNVPFEVVLDANDIQSGQTTPGTTLFIPGARMKTEELKLALGDFFIWPMKEHRITSPYGWRTDPFTGVGGRVHEGLDLAARTGTTVKAAMDGRITYRGTNAIYGNYLIMTHANGFSTLYGHLSQFSVKQGVYVYQGTKIGESGGTGHVTGEHLHFGVYRNGKSINPMSYLVR